MKPTTRRLGRGLGAFLDFGPSGEDGAAFVSGAITADATSILETSVASPVRAPAPAPAVARQPAPAPVPVPAPAAPVTPRFVPAPPPVADEPEFIDDVFFDDVMEQPTVAAPVTAPAPVAAPVPVVAPAPVAQAPTRLPPEPPPATDDDVFIDDVVAPLSFGDIDLE